MCICSILACCAPWAVVVADELGLEPVEVLAREVGAVAQPLRGVRGAGEQGESSAALACHMAHDSDQACMAM